MRFKIILFLSVLCSVTFSQNIKRKGSLGVALFNHIPDSLVRSLKLDSKEGALVNYIFPNSTAENLKLKSHDFIISCNGQKINSTPELIALAKPFREDDPVTVSVMRKGKLLSLTGKVVGKPMEQSSTQDIVYGGFKYENGNVRTIYKKPKGQKPLGTVYFIHGISCYSLDNMQSNDITKMAFDAMIEKGFAVYCIEKLGVGDSYNGVPCEEIGYNKELDVFRAGYKHLLTLKEVDTSQIFIFGHSLGGISAPIIAQEFNPKGVIVYGTGLKPWSDYLLDAVLIQSLLYGGDLAALQETVESIKPTFFEYFYKNTPIEELVKSPNHLIALKTGLGYDETSRLAHAGRTPQFHKELNEHNLPLAWRETRSFVLAAYGEADIAANNSADHEAIVKYVNKVHPGKATYLFVPKTNHTFQEVGTMDEFIKMQSNQGEYQKYAAQHFNQKLFDTICDWMKDKLTKKL